MSQLTDQLRADLTIAMKARDEVTTATLRMALAAFQTEQVSGSAARDLTEDDELVVLTREAKRRRESAAAFDDGGRPELADRERAEGEVLARYLPTPLTDEELTALVRDEVAVLGAEGPSAMGSVMKAVTPKVAGRADGKRVAAIVRAALAD